MSNYINREVTKMAVSYKKLWKLLIDKDMMKKELVSVFGDNKVIAIEINKNEEKAEKRSGYDFYCPFCNFNVYRCVDTFPGPCPCHNADLRCFCCVRTARQ